MSWHVIMNSNNFPMNFAFEYFFFQVLVPYRFLILLRLGFGAGGLQDILKKKTNSLVGYGGKG